MDFARYRLLDQNFGMCITPQDLIFPCYTPIGSNYYRPWKWCIESGSRDIGSTIDDQKDRFKITLDVQHFRPNEISVKVVDKEIIVEGKHEERQDNHGVISRQFKRRYVLPSNCIPELVSSTLSSDGILTINAGKKSMKDLKDKEITVPIQMCGPCPKKEQTEIKNSLDSTQKKLEDTINSNMECKNEIDIKTKEEISHLKPDVTKGATTPADNLLMDIKEAGKETDNLLKITSDMAQIDASATLGLSKTENIKEQSKAAMGNLLEKVSEKNIANLTETSTFKSMMKETLASEEVSSFKSSMSSSIKVSGEQISDVISAVSAELKEAAENI